MSYNEPFATFVTKRIFTKWRLTHKFDSRLWMKLRWLCKVIEMFRKTDVFNNEIDSGRPSQFF